MKFSTSAIWRPFFGPVLAFAVLMMATLAGTNRVAAQTAVDVELVLAVDVSLSMDPEEQHLQRGGYIAAFRDANVIAAIKAGGHGRISVTYIEWAGPETQIHLIPWRLIDGAEKADAFAAELSAKEYSRHRMTSISAGLDYANQQFGAGGFKGTRKVIDVSGDGANNSGAMVAAVRDRIVGDGVVINGLPLLLKPTLYWSAWDVPDLDKFYSNCVIGGPGAFMIPIHRSEEFVTATRTKLLLEISGLMQQPRIIPAQSAYVDGRYDCNHVERTMRSIGR